MESLGSPNFREMCGALDATHIRLVNKPKRAYQPAYYWCQHDAHTVLLQGICDHDRIFLNTCVLALGGTHEATCLRKSFFYQETHGP